MSIKAFADNYIWLFRAGNRAWVVDPGESAGVLAYLDRNNLILEGILLTHHHEDHTGGVDRLRSIRNARVYGPARERLPEPVIKLLHGDEVDAMGVRFRVIDVPGHTSAHIAYYAEDFLGRPLLFCGDTLFSGGCGRLFEGTPAQMLASLDRLAGLPGDTLVCCAHEYTVGNLRFASAVEPGNRDVAEHLERCLALRALDKSTLPSAIKHELKINPFLRCREPAVAEVVRRRAEAGIAMDDVAVFAALRAWKDRFV
ncbi:hydroxyacylglutathione hydrolase [Methylibium sp.]|uniref:hydroxyacylglutathione hydrolase n=1 Tax=Methylibium sp. TaxID=2067992 RepID=UPI003D0F3CA7